MDSITNNSTDVNPEALAVPFEIIEYMLAVGKMRELQRQYFGGNRTGGIVARAKRAEALVDKLHTEIMARMPAIQPVDAATSFLETLFAEVDQ